MGKPVLLLRLEGPLQSWGGRARWDVRDTRAEPTKSGVIGLLGCALGYERGDVRLEELDRALRFGVRVEAPGQVMEDYQTVTGYLTTAQGGYKITNLKGKVEGKTKRSKESTFDLLDRLREDSTVTPSTVISPRFYLEDAAFLVGFEARADANNTLLESCAFALQNPRWTLFLGRKACVPTRPIFEALTEDYEGLEEALRSRPWSWLGGDTKARKRKWQELTGFVEAEHGTYRRQDAVRVNPFRQYEFVTLESFRVSPPGGE